jgi:electron transfer flavoprotein alpha subunit
MKILVFIQVDDNKINKMSLEALKCGQELTSDVSAITFNEDAANELSNYKLKEVIFAKNVNLNDYNPLNYTTAFESLVDESCNAMLFAHTYETRDWVPRLSARVNYPFIADCIALNNNNNSLIITRQTYQGKLNNDFEINSNVFCSIQSGSFKADNLEKGTTEITIVPIELGDINNTIRAEEKFKEQKGGVDLSSADLIVSVGRGIAKEENIPLAQELTDLLNAELGSSRPIVDYGWLPHDRQIGSSGQVVSPKLYFSLGVSGAIQHQVGMKGSDKIIAINKDGNAPIFEIADYSVIGDLLEIVPKLITKIKEA